MRCPYCASEDTRVTDSRPVEETNSIRRRRQCDKCGKRFTTYEKIETIPLVVIKKDNTRQQYDRSKIESGVMRACYKRAVPIAQIQSMIDRVEAEIYNRGTGEIKSSEIEGCRNLYGRAKEDHQITDEVRDTPCADDWKSC